jgi:hypothetical protein
MKFIEKNLDIYSKLWKDIGSFSDKKKRWKKDKISCLNLEDFNESIKYGRRTCVILKKQLQFKEIPN